MHFFTKQKPIPPRVLSFSRHVTLRFSFLIMIRNLVKPVVAHPWKGSGHAMPAIIPEISQSLQAAQASSKAYQLYHIIKLTINYRPLS